MAELLQVECCSCHPNNNIKALKDDNNNQQRIRGFLNGMRYTNPRFTDLLTSHTSHIYCNYNSNLSSVLHSWFGIRERNWPTQNANSAIFLFISFKMTIFGNNKCKNKYEQDGKALNVHTEHALTARKCTFSVLKLQRPS